MRTKALYSWGLLRPESRADALGQKWGLSQRGTLTGVAGGSGPQRGVGAHSGRERQSGQHSRSKRDQRLQNLSCVFKTG